ncbi:MAG: hypothetical protein VB100_13955 [Angelakisella sp.]|nr:hypothetical protein [Angelakisella sp.]
MDKSLFESIPGLQDYFDTLPKDVQGKLLFQAKDVTSLGEIMQIAESLRATSLQSNENNAQA